MKKANFLATLALSVVFVFGAVTANAQIRGLGQQLKSAATEGISNMASKISSDKVTFVASFGGLGYKKVEDEYSKFGFNVNGNALQFGCYYSF